MQNFQGIVFMWKQTYGDFQMYISVPLTVFAWSPVLDIGMGAKYASPLSKQKAYLRSSRTITIELFCKNS